MIGPKHDNGVVAIARGVERIKQKPNALVSEIDARQVRLNALPPGQFIFDDLLDDGGVGDETSVQGPPNHPA